MLFHRAMTGKQFSALLDRLYGPDKTATKAAEALECSKRTIERYRARRKVPPLVARALAEIAATMRAA